MLHIKWNISGLNFVSIWIIMLYSLWHSEIPYFQLLECFILSLSKLQLLFAECCIKAY